MNNHNPYRTTCIRFTDFPAASQGEVQQALQQMFAEHRLIVERNAWENIFWEHRPATDGDPTIEVVVSQMRNLPDIMEGLNTLALEHHFQELMPNQYQLVVQEKPALTTETTLHKAWLIRKNRRSVVHTEQVVTASSAISRRPAACRKVPRHTVRNVQRILTVD